MTALAQSGRDNKVDTLSKLRPGLAETFPPAFDAEFYRTIHADLVRFNPEQLREHYELHGRTEGRRASAGALREGFLACIPADARSLEIGPFFNPLLSGPTAEYFDVLDHDGLIERAGLHGLPTEKIPAKIHYVSENGDLSVVPGGFDVVLSSHAIEHTPNLVGHLTDVGRLLRPGGCFAVIVPDRRFCFDALMPDSTLADVVEAHVLQRKGHRPASVIEHLALTTHNDPARHWQGDHGDAGDVAQRALNGIKVWEDHAGQYVDVHAWRFTPPVFRLLCETVHAMGLSPLRVAHVYDTPYGAIEFCAVLERPL